MVIHNLDAALTPDSRSDGTTLVARVTCISPCKRLYANIKENDIPSGGEA